MFFVFDTLVTGTVEDESVEIHSATEMLLGFTVKPGVVTDKMEIIYPAAIITDEM